MTTVTLNGNVYSDVTTPGALQMEKGGHRTNFFPLLQDFLTESSTRIAATGLSVKGTSTSSIAVASSGTITPTLSTSKGWGTGTRLRLSKTSAPANYVEGVVNSYDPTTGVSSITLDNSGGTGTHTDWTVGVAGDKGNTGATGSMATLTQVARTSNTQLVAADSAKAFTITGSGGFTQTFVGAATLGSTWWCFYQNDSTGIITLDPNASETIDGAASVLLYPGQGALIKCDGTALSTIQFWKRDQLLGQAILAASCF